MTFGGTSFTNFAGAMGRTLRGKANVHAITDKDFDPYERAPEMRSDIEALLAIEVDDLVEVEAAEEEKLRASEKLEHDTMCLIRGALYPVDQA